MSISRRALFGSAAALAVAPIVMAKASSVGLLAPAGHLIVVDGNVVRWNDPHTGSWEASVQNEAGFWASPYQLTGPASLSSVGVIVIPHEYGTWLMSYAGGPFIYTFQIASVIKQPRREV